MYVTIYEFNPVVNNTSSNTLMGNLECAPDKMVFINTNSDTVEMKKYEFPPAEWWTTNYYPGGLSFTIGENNEVAQIKLYSTTYKKITISKLEAGMVAP